MKYAIGVVFVPFVVAGGIWLAGPIIHELAGVSTATWKVIAGAIAILFLACGMALGSRSGD